MLDPTEEQRLAYLKAARDNYENDDCDIEIDDDAKLSNADNGSWVAAWVWVNDEELGIEEEELDIEEEEDHAPTHE